MEDSQAEQVARRVSVILVSFNNAAALRRCLASLESSGDRDSFEVVVVDSGSVDECPRLDAEFPSINMLRLPRNFGMVKALNIGMRTATGEFYLFLEPEMELAAGAIPALVAELDAQPEAAAACPLAVDSGGETLTRVHPAPLPAELQSAWQEGELRGWSAAKDVDLDYFTPPAMMVRSYFLKGLRYIDERYGDAWWDLEICTQILRASKKVRLVSAATVVVRQTRDTSSWPAGVRGLLAADRALGAAVWCGKHYGWMQGFKFRLLALLRAMGALFSLKDMACRFATLRCLLSGQKLDGSQTVI